MTFKNKFSYCIPEFDKIITVLESAGIKFEWYTETAPSNPKHGVTQALIIDNQELYFIMQAIQKGAVKRETITQTQTATKTQCHKIIPFPTRHGA